MASRSAKCPRRPTASPCYLHVGSTSPRRRVCKKSPGPRRLKLRLVEPHRLDQTGKTSLCVFTPEDLSLAVQARTGSRLPPAPAPTMQHICPSAFITRGDMSITETARRSERLIFFCRCHFVSLLNCFAYIVFPTAACPPVFIDVGAH